MDEHSDLSLSIRGFGLDKCSRPSVAHSGVYSKSAGKPALQPFQFVPSFPGSSFCSCKRVRGPILGPITMCSQPKWQGAILWMLTVYCGEELQQEHGHPTGSRTLFCWSHISYHQKSQPWFAAQGYYVTVKDLQRPIVFTRETWLELQFQGRIISLVTLFPNSGS